MMNRPYKPDVIKKPAQLSMMFVDQIYLIKPGSYLVFCSKQHPTNAIRNLTEIRLEHNDMLNDIRGLVADVPLGEPMWMSYVAVDHFVSRVIIHVRSGQDILAAK